MFPRGCNKSKFGEQDRPTRLAGKQNHCFSAMNRQVCLAVSLQVQLPQSDPSRHRLLEDSRGHARPMPGHFPRKPHVHGDQSHLAVLPVTLLLGRRARAYPRQSSGPSIFASIPALLSSSQSPNRTPQTHPNRLPFPSLIHRQIFLPKFADHYAHLAHNHSMIVLRRVMGFRLFALCHRPFVAVCCGGKNNGRKNLVFFAKYSPLNSFKINRCAPKLRNNGLQRCQFYAPQPV